MPTDVIEVRNLVKQYGELLVALNRRADARQMLEAAGKALLQIKFISSEGRRQREDAIEAVRARLGF